METRHLNMVKTSHLNNFLDCEAPERSYSGSHLVKIIESAVKLFLGYNVACRIFCFAHFLNTDTQIYKKKCLALETIFSNDSREPSEIV
jgi:hypothetical protein